MIDRFVLFRMSGASRAEAIVKVREAIASAPEALSVTIGTPADDSARKWDVSVVIRCADLDALAAMLARPAVADLLGTWLPAHTEVIKAWSFEVTSWRS